MSEQVHSPVERFMTPDPVCVDLHELSCTASVQMRASGFRHFPVVDKGKLVGIVSERDLHRAIALPTEDPSSEEVEGAMSRKVYAVPPDRPVGEVAARMVESKYGCAVVVRGDRVVGIFTTTDALRVLVGIVEAWR